MRLSDSAIELRLTLKSLFNLPLRQVTGLVASCLTAAFDGALSAQVIPFFRQQVF